MGNNNCPNCGSNEFITAPNQYDVLTFRNGNFKTLSVQQVDVFKIYCRECSEEIENNNNNRLLIVKE